jgi:hypothetical protein
MPTGEYNGHLVTINSMDDVAKFLAFVMDDLTKIRIRLNKKFDLGVTCEETHTSCGNEANDERNSLKLCNVHAELRDDLEREKFNDKDKS